MARQTDGQMATQQSGVNPWGACGAEALGSFLDKCVHLAA